MSSSAPNTSFSWRDFRVGNSTRWIWGWETFLWVASRGRTGFFHGSRNWNCLRGESYSLTRFERLRWAVRRKQIFIYFPSFAECHWESVEIVSLSYLWNLTVWSKKSKMNAFEFYSFQFMVILPHDARTYEKQIRPLLPRSVLAGKMKTNCNCNDGDMRTRKNS